MDLNLNRDIDYCLDGIYQEYLINKDYNTLLNRALENIEVLGNNLHRQLDEKSILPIIKKKGTIDVHKYGLIEVNLYLDLSIFYIQDINEMIRFLTKDEVIKYSNIREVAVRNLRNIPTELEFSDKDIGLCSYYGTNYAASLLLCHERMLDVENKLGTVFLISVPNADTLIFAPDNKMNISLLKRMLKENSLELVSDKVYRYNAGDISYAESMNYLNIIH